VGTLVLPFGNPRHEHELDVFREFALPDEMSIVVGVIDVTSSWVEHPKLIAKRLVAAAEMIGDPSRVIAGTDCGFGTFWDYALVADEIVWLKLKALREGADLASEQLWG
jgi:5-methyltetrahydropteroyltriglutamate--homocysteine methyltransferase